MVIGWIRKKVEERRALDESKKKFRDVYKKELEKKRDVAFTEAAKAAAEKRAQLDAREAVESMNGPPSIVKVLRKFGEGFMEVGESMEADARGNVRVTKAASWVGTATEPYWEGPRMEPGKRSYYDAMEPYWGGGKKKGGGR